MLKKMLVVVSLVLCLVVSLVVAEDTVAESMVSEKREIVATIEEAETKKAELDHYVDRENLSYMISGLTVEEAEANGLSDKEIVGITRDFEESTLEYGIAIFDYEDNQVSFMTAELIESDIKADKAFVYNVLTAVFAFSILVAMFIYFAIEDKIDEIKATKEAARKAEAKKVVNTIVSRKHSTIDNTIVKEAKEKASIVRATREEAKKEAALEENKELLNIALSTYCNIVNNEIECRYDRELALVIKLYSNHIEEHNNMFKTHLEEVLGKVVNDIK